METMEFLSKKPLLITDTILRDAHQSQAATRMTIKAEIRFVPIPVMWVRMV